jgi:hypothetical protein
MVSFDLFLVNHPEEPIRLEELRAALATEPCIFQDRTDPGRLVYRNPETGVVFSVMLGPDILGEAAHDGPEIEDGVEAPVDDEADGTAADDEQDTEDDGVEDDAEAPVELPPVSLSVPFLCPTFFLQEALLLADRLARAGHLAVEHPSHEHDGKSPTESPAGGGPAAPVTPADPEKIVESWIIENREALAKQQDTSGLARWTPRQSAFWWTYGGHRAQLEEQLAGDGLVVPPLQLARHNGELKTLCVWEVTQPTLLPRCDLVLLRRDHYRKGLIRTRRVTEEGIAGGERIWNLLAPFSEVRKDPVELLIFREARTPPSQVAAELEVLRLEPVQSAKRAQLFGVVDFESEAEADGA